ncbi:phosphatidylinositol-3,5-bisphosphate 5-phosphatase [Blomia tropicalis]|nr:phosphatidylinositol-3,5-bisphosphate 5-phosphatase [Blomia tropicalis]
MTIDLIKLEKNYENMDNNNNNNKLPPPTDNAEPNQSIPPPSTVNEKINGNNNFCIEKIFCYELKNFFYIVGSSNCKTKHRVLKFDRRFKNNLVISDSKRIMSTAQLNEYRHNEGFDPVTSRIEPTVAFGIVGFIQFLEGYYLILIIKRRCVALIGRHSIYKIEDTSMFYDLSNTLQYNLSPIYLTNVDQFKCGFGHTKTLWNMSEDFLNSADHNDTFDDGNVFINPNMKFVWNEYLLSPMTGAHNDFFLYICHGFVSQAAMPITGRSLLLTLIARRSKKYAGTRYLKRGANCEGFPANEVETEQIVHDANLSSFRYGLLSSFVQLRGSVPTYWSQNIVNIAPKPPINIDLKDPYFVAAGKHFNNLLYDYGSPAIVLNLVKRKEKKAQESILYNEFEQAVEYLNQFIPNEHQIILIGLDMARISKAKDQNVINRLSDIALYTLRNTGYFQSRDIAINRNSGWPRNTMMPNNDEHRSNRYSPIMQTGVTRVNCVDCLDRTNTAQFILGRIALAHQLFTMGIIAKPELQFDTDIVLLLEELYEDHGDTLALQYGGSQLVHRIKTYRKIAPLTSQSKDIMQSLSRYYSNAFSDCDKQNAINLFLGVYRPNRQFPLWSMLNDYQLHHSFARASSFSLLSSDIIASGGGCNGGGGVGATTSTTNGADIVTGVSDVHISLASSGHRNRYTKWWSDEVALCLPRAARELFKHSYRHLDSQYVKRIDTYDWFYDVHRLHESTILADTFLFNVKKSKSYMDAMSHKKLTDFRTQNRQSLVGIPLNTSLADESDPSDVSDCEQEQKFIIRFEDKFKNGDNDSQSLEEIGIECTGTDSNEYMFHYGINRIPSKSTTPVLGHRSSTNTPTPPPSSSASMSTLARKDKEQTKIRKYYNDYLQLKHVRNVMRQTYEPIVHNLDRLIDEEKEMRRILNERTEQDGINCYLLKSIDDDQWSTTSSMNRARLANELTNLKMERYQHHLNYWEPIEQSELMDHYAEYFEPTDPIGCNMKQYERLQFEYKKYL